MTIARATDVAVQRMPAAPGHAPRAEVLLAGRATGWIVDGAVLEAALRCGERLLLFMTDDVPYEEVLSIQLLGADGRVVDAVALGGGYATGHFGACTIEPPDAVRFRFIDDVEWCVRVLPAPRLRLPLWCAVRGVRRKPGWFAQLDVSRRPLPA